MHTIATIKDVANMAGVSTTTVSHVINKTRFVSEDLIERVTSAITELNYQPYGLARSLRKKQSGTIGIVIPENTNPFFAEVVRGIEDTCFEHGYSVFLCNSDGEPAKERNYLQLLIEKGVDGLVLVSTGDDEEAMQLLENREIPKVIVDREISGLHMDSVLVDHIIKECETQDDRGALERAKNHSHLKVAMDFHKLGVYELSPFNKINYRNEVFV